MHKMMADSPARKQPEGRDFCLLYSLLFSQHQDQYLIHNGCPINTYGLVEILTQVDNRRNCKKKSRSISHFLTICVCMCLFVPGAG